MKKTLFYIVICFVLYACKKEEGINPYEDPNLAPPNTNDTNYFNDPTSFAALHNNIFIPTCANSG